MFQIYLSSKISKYISDRKFWNIFVIDIFQGATVSAIVEASQLPLSIGWLPNYYWKKKQKKCHGKYFESDLDEKLVDLA